MPIFHKKKCLHGERDIPSLDMEMYITSVCKYCVTYFFSIFENNDDCPGAVLYSSAYCPQR